MMREIFFRAKDFHNRWRYGYYDGSADDPALIDEDNETGAFWIKGETLGQFTGLYDKNGVKIFEGDIVKHYNEFGEYDIGRIYWNDKTLSFRRTSFRPLDYSPFGAHCEYEVIGNIYDNPELLEENK